MFNEEKDVLKPYRQELQDELKIWKKNKIQKK